MAGEEIKFEVPGFQAAGIAAGIKEDGKKDLALLYSEVPAKVAGVFTTNVFKAAPVLLDMERIKGGASRAVIINSGNANAATGDEGYQDAVKTARFCAGPFRSTNPRSSWPRQASSAGSCPSTRWPAA
jgi:glutamate N-acetyltransferase/amino-acid N-acetyltransferase